MGTTGSGLGSPRLTHFHRVGARCPACGDRQQQQVTEWLVAPASWRCRVCKQRYYLEPEGTPTLAEERIAMTILFPRM